MPKQSEMIFSGKRSLFASKNSRVEYIERGGGGYVRIDARRDSGLPQLDVHVRGKARRKQEI